MDYEERKSTRNRHINLSAYIPATLVEVIDRIADADMIASPRVVERLIRKGLAVERAEREAKAKAKAEA